MVRKNRNLYNDPINATYWADADFRKVITNTLKLDDVKASDYDAIFLAGGHDLISGKNGQLLQTVKRKKCSQRI